MRQQLFAELFGEELFWLFMCRPTFSIAGTFSELVHVSSKKS